MRRSFALLLVAFVFACNKDGDAPTAGQPGPCGSVAGVHRTDYNGVLMYPADSSDWRWSDDWCANVEALFADRPPVTWSTTAPDSLHIACFPNPTPNQFMIGFFRDDTSYVDIRFVDAQFGLIAALDSITTTYGIFHADPLGITTDQLIRAYYRVVHADGTAHRGHGDVQFEL